MRLYAKQDGIVLPSDVGFTQALLSLNSTSHQRHLAIAQFESLHLDRNVPHLQAVSAKLFGAYLSSVAAVSTFHAGNLASDEASDVIDEEEDQTFSAKGEKPRPGYEESALKCIANVFGDAKWYGVCVLGRGA